MVIHTKSFAFICLQIELVVFFFLSDRLVLYSHLVHFVYAIACWIAVFIVETYKIETFTRIHHAEGIDFIPFFALPIYPLSFAPNVKIQKRQLVFFDKSRCDSVYAIINSFIAVFAFVFSQYIRIRFQSIGL